MNLLSTFFGEKNARGALLNPGKGCSSGWGRSGCCGLCCYRAWGL